MANNNETTTDNPFGTGDATKKKDKPQQQPNYADLVEVDSAQPNYSDLVEVNKGIGGHLKDFGKSLASGAASLPDIAIGIGDLYSGGRAGKAIEDSGIYTPGSGSDYWRDQKSINSKAQDQQFAAADGIIDKTKVALSNPTMITNAIGESLAPMVAGGMVGRGINVASKGKVGAAAAGAVGEGTVMAGAQAENIRQETEDGLLTNGQVGAAVATGVAGSAFGYLGGRIAQKLGFDDVDNLMANGVRTGAVQEAAKDIPISSIPKSILAGAISEGILEELPQSVSEQALQNIALGKDWHENLDDAIVMGTLAGMAMGGGINAYTSTNKYLGQQDNPEPNLPMLPGGNGALEGEFIPEQRGQSTTDAQGRTTYEYDQFSTDADNRLTNNGINPNNGFNPGDTTGPVSDNPINPNNPPAPNGNYFDSDQAFDDLLNEVPPLNQTPSQRMGLNPNEGPLSTAAALAVDTGVSSQMQQAAAAAAQNENNNSPLTTAAGLLNAPNENSSSNESGTGSSSNGPLGETSNSQLRETSGSISTVANSNADDSKDNNLERQGDSSILQNAIGNGGQDASGGINSVNSVSGIGEPSQAAQGQSNRNNLDTIGNDSVLSGENEGAATSRSTIGTTASDSQSRTVDPILGADGKNKWFGNQNKAQAFIDKKNLGNDYQVVQDGKRFEIQPKAPVQDAATPVQDEISTLEQQLATEKSVPKKEQIRKQITKLQKDSPIDQAAHAAATSIQNDLPEPTQAQIEAGNYKKGHIKVHGLDIAVENPRGSERRGTDPDGKPWSHNMSDHYGYIKRTTGADQEHIDTYVGKNTESENVFVVDQINQGTGGFDEHKVMLGFDSQEEAVAAYQSNFDKGWKVGPVTQMSKDQFKDWLKNSDTSKPIVESQQKSDVINPSEQKIRDALTRHDNHQNGKKMQDLATIVANRIKQEGPAYFTLGWNKDSQMSAEAQDFIEDVLDNAMSNLGIKGFDDVDSFDKLTKDVLESIEDVYTPSDDSSWNDRPVKDKDGNYNAPKLVKVKDESGRTRYVLEHELNDPNIKYLRNFSESGRRSVVKISRDNISQDAPKKETVHPVNQWQEEMNSALEKADPEHPSFKKLQLNAKHGLRSVSDRATALRQAREIEDKTKAEEAKQPKADAENKDEPLYSRQSGSKKAGKTIDQVRDALIKRFGQDTIEALEQSGKLRIAQSYDVEGVEGFYHNGRVTLIADNLTDDSIVPTFLHELGGHGGFQNMMSQEKYSELMGMFNDMVKRGHPMAKAAKELAEREAGTDRQQLEYLPYLLTLASTMQVTNALQRNALQRFIDRIVSAVKAWAFDRLSINMDLTPNDMVALAERMVQQAHVQKPEQKVRAQYQGSKQWMKAPNGKDTNLTEQQWLQVRTPEFKNWFGDWENDPKNASEVLDENGEPKVVYHGTAAQFTEFKLGGGLLGRGIYLTDNANTAEIYANVRSNKNGGVVMPLFVNMRNSFKTNGTATRDEIVAATESGEYQGVLHSFENDEVLVALNPTQVKIAIGNAGTFDSNDPSVLFSRRADYMNDMLKTIANNMNKQGVAKIKQQASFKFKDSLQYLLQGLGRRQLTDIYSKILPQLTKYNILAAQMDADKNEAGANADELVVRWAKIKDEQQLAELMHEATLAKIDPDKPYVSGDSVSKYKQLRDNFNSLSPEAQKMYRDARDAYKKHHRDVLNAIKERIMRASIDNTKKAELMQQMDANFYHSLKGVYFPLSRFGKYVIIVRKSNGEVESVNRAETMKEAEALRKELIGMFPNSNVEKVIRDKAFNASRDMVGRGFMSNLFEELDKFGLPASKQAELEDILGQLYLSSLPDLSWAKHGIHRKGTAGFSQDARRAFAQNMFHGASYLAKLRYADVMAEQLDEMQKYADTRKNDPNYDQPVAQAVIDEMNKRHESLMAPDSHPLSSALTSLGFIYFLGLSVASGAVNLLQTVLVAYPQMGAKWGFDNAFSELKIAGLQSIKGLNDISKSLKGDELEAYNEAVRRGVIDVTQAHDLAGIAQGEDSGVMWKLRPIMRWASFIFHQAERFNREITFVAAYRLAKKAGAKHDGAFEQAMKATYDGHSDYSSGNRPRIMQGNVAKVILLFKQFGQNMLYTMIRSLHQSFKAETPAARREARRALGGIMASHAVFAGTMGLPLIGTILGLMSFFGGSDDEPWDAETALKNNLSDVLGVTVTDVLMNGVSRLTPWDISGRVSIDNLIIPQTREGLEGESQAQAVMTAAIGPIGGIFVNILKGFQEISEGHGMRGVETMSPTFMRGPLRAIRFANEGAQDKTGVSITDEVGIAGIIGQAAGFAPSEVRLATEGRSAVYNLQKELDARRSSLMAQFARARLEGDADTENDVWEEIKAFNAANPERRINKIQAMQSYRKRKKRIDTAKNGMVITRKKRDDMDEGRFAFDDED